MRLINIAIVFLLSISLVSATEITVKTLPGHDVFISPIDNSNQQIIITEKVRSDYKGEAKYTLSSNAPSINVLVVVKLYEERKFREEFGPFSPSDTIYLELLPEGYVDPLANLPNTTTEPTSNITVNETELVQNSSEETEITNESAITGQAISETSFPFDNKLLKYTLYAFGVLLILAIAVFSTAMIMKNKKKYSPPAMKPMKLYPPKSPPPSSDLPLDSSELSSIERRIQEIDSQIKQIKTKEAEKKLQDKIKALEELKHNDPRY